MMFCCGCLNTEAKLRVLDENETHDIREFLGLKVGSESLNTLYMSNFKANLTQSKVVLTNVEPALETYEGMFFPIIQEIKSEVADEGTLNEASRDVKRNFMEVNVLNNEYIVNNCKESIEDGEIAPERAPSLTDKELKEEIVIKAKFSDRSQAESVEIDDVGSGTPPDDDTPLEMIKERRNRFVLDGIESGKIFLHHQLCER
ncbi:hypothetical protein K1T71_014993 [Dendrolimus kikuchii]|nr:hypothetical protein K1T71_014993 [Dendrolimus kikuchii]